MAQVPSGTTFHIASAYGASQNTTIVSNASEAVVTCAGHGYSNGDVVEVTSGWGGLHLRVFEVKSVTTDTFVLKGFDSSDTGKYAAGLGIGSVREITDFTQVQQVLDTQSSGGEPRPVNYKYTESDVEYSMNNGFAAVVYTLTLDDDSDTTAGYAALKTLTNSQTDTCLKMLMKNGKRKFLPCTVALNEATQLQEGQVNRVTCVFNGKNRMTSYKASE